MVVVTERAGDDVLVEVEVDLGADPVSDARLVRELITGSETALAQLYDRHGATVFAKAVHLTRDRSIAEDVVQETFLALWNRAERFDPARGTLLGWLLTIAHNRAIDHHRYADRHQRAVAFSSFVGDDADDASINEWLADSAEPVAMAWPEPSPEAALGTKETRSAIAEALSSLGEKERSVITLAYDAGLSQSEIADRLGWPIGTVKTRTRRALRHLRDRLAASQGQTSAGGPLGLPALGTPRRPCGTGSTCPAGAAP